MNFFFARQPNKMVRMMPEQASSDSILSLFAATKSSIWENPTTTALICDPDDLAPNQPSPNAPENIITVVLDLDETLVYAREGSVCIRYGAREFLQKLAEYGFEIIVWTAG
eukprot:389003_1